MKDGESFGGERYVDTMSEGKIWGCDWRGVIRSIISEGFYFLFCPFFIWRLRWREGRLWVVDISDIQVSSRLFSLEELE